MPDDHEHTTPNPEDLSTVSSPSPDRQPDRIGPYKILAKIGEGGMGIVYLAEQETPIRRRIALKVIKPGMDSKQVLARFESERQALALMNHPNVARVLDAGTTERGQPYFVMEHVPGIPITEYCDKHLLDNRKRLELFIQVCDAIQHAHQKGIIHRDIKPANVLVAVLDGKPVPKVIDFGVAKATIQRLTERSLFTEQGILIGTPEYMSPEQADMTPLDVDTRSDVYSLGVLLYELLVGALPFDPAMIRRAAFHELRRIIRETDPPRPSTRVSTLGNAAAESARRRHTDPRSLEKQLRGELDWITMRAMEKDKTRRYASASEFASDVNRHLRDEPVNAGPPSTVYVLLKLLRKHRGAALASSVILLCLALGLVVSTVLYRRAEDARTMAVQREQDALYQSYVANIGAADLALSVEEVAQAKERLSACELRFRAWEWGYLQFLCDSSSYVLEGHTGPVHFVTFSADERTVAAVSINGDTDRISAWDLPSQTLLASYVMPNAGELEKGTASVVWVFDTVLGLNPVLMPRRMSTVAPLATALPTSTPYGLAELPSYPEDKVRTLAESIALHAPPLVIAADGRRLASGLWKKTAYISDPRSGHLLCSIPNSGGTITALALDDDGSRLFLGSEDGTIIIVDATSCDIVGQLIGHSRPVSFLRLFRGGARLLSVGEDNTVRIWDSPTNRSALLSTGRQSGVSTVAISSDGARIAVATADIVRAWDSNFRTSLATIRRPGGKVAALGFSDDGRRLIMVSSVGESDELQLRAWEPRSGMEILKRDLGITAPGLTHLDHALVLNSTSTLVAVAHSKVVSILEARSGRRRNLLIGHDDLIASIAFSPGGRRLAAGSENGSVRLWEVESRVEYMTAEGKEPGLEVEEVPNRDPGSSSVLSPDGSLAVTLLARSGILWRTDTGARVATIRSTGQEIWPVAFSRDGAHIASVDPDGQVRLWDVSSGTVRAEWAPKSRLPIPLENPQVGQELCFSPSGSRIASATNDGTVWIWEVASGRLITTLFVGEPVTDENLPKSELPRSPESVKEHLRRLYPSGSRSLVSSLAFSPNDAQLAVASLDGIVTTWNASTGKRLRELRRFDQEHATSVLFSHDGERLFVGSSNGVTTMWDLRSGERIAEMRGHVGSVRALVLDPNGKRLFSRGDDCTVRVWDPLKGVLLLTFRRMGSGGLGLSLDGTRLVALDSSSGVAFTRRSNANQPRRALLAAGQR